MKLNKIISRMITISVASMGILALHTTAISGPGPGGGNEAGGSESNLDPRFRCKWRRFDLSMKPC